MKKQKNPKELKQKNKYRNRNRQMKTQIIKIVN